MRSMMVTLCLVLVATSSACGQEIGWDDLPGAVLEPTIQGDVSGLLLTEEKWRDEVSQAAQLWNDALREDCGKDVFVMGDIGREIRVVEDQFWVHGWAGGVTFYDDRVGSGRGHVEVRALGLRVPVLVHELGHAIGLQHLDEGETGEPTAMTVSLSQAAPQPIDARMAAELLGCR